MTTEMKIGSKAFKRRTGADNDRVRVMEALNVISPSKTESGWRQYTEADVQAAIAWMAINSRKRRRGRPRSAARLRTTP